MTPSVADLRLGSVTKPALLPAALTTPAAATRCLPEPGLHEHQELARPAPGAMPMSLVTCWSSPGTAPPRGAGPAVGVSTSWCTSQSRWGCRRRRSRRWLPPAASPRSATLPVPQFTIAEPARASALSWWHPCALLLAILSRPAHAQIRLARSPTERRYYPKGAKRHLGQQWSDRGLVSLKQCLGPPSCSKMPPKAASSPSCWSRRSRRRSCSRAVTSRSRDCGSTVSRAMPTTGAAKGCELSGA